jgi:hypothetical protein
MGRRSLALFLLLGSAVAGCRPQSQPSPAQSADLTGRVIDVQLVRGLGGLEVGPGAAGGGDIRRLHIRIASSRRSAPGTDAYIGVDGVTQLTRAVLGSDNGIAELQGAFVRVWFRGPPRTATPVETVAMARVVAIDSVADRAPAR